MKKLNYLFWLCFLVLIAIIPMLWGGHGLLVIIFTGLMLLSFYFTIVYSYNMVVSFFGFKNIKRDYLIKQDKTKFLILVAAHNEESVIRETIRNLKQINYDKNLYDICIVSDNSTDLTTQIALNENVLVVDTIKNEFEREGVGKPAGIQYALRKLGFENVKRQYDMIMVLDADNFVSKNILKEVNSQFITKGRPTAIQTYLDSKNYSKFMSLAYSVVFWTNNRFMQLAKYKLNLPNSIGGTGFFVKTDWLIDKGGFKFDSLTEDLEMEIEIINDGGRILWNDHASIYDEKPEKTKVSMIQRHRWIKGHWYVAFKQILPLTKRFIMTLNIKYLDKIFFLMSMGKAFHILLIFLVLIINIILLTHHHMLVSTLAALNILDALHLLNDYMFYITGINALLIIYSFVILPMYSVYAKLRNINPIKIVLSLQWFMITDFIVQLFGLFTWPNQQTWIRTPHSKVSIETSEEAYQTPGTYEHDNQPAIQVPEVGLNTSNHIVEQHK
ncbi:glycosyltransferase family 2 protein [Mammaliicoccus sciuri]|uniref:glycosyltransferase family 2 protein n=1 Tax=Mammaliicoccus sciuri TaxID=1296 RepID=UPI0023405F8C|nr:glycosyltransferase family 2 protein [Mammaliicoccus sciuri]MDC5694212.1 glycosyltransferase family 2 protein [Mammaliicoccus sciuri]